MAPWHVEDDESHLPDWIRSSFFHVKVEAQIGLVPDDGELLNLSGFCLS